MSGRDPSYHADCANCQALCCVGAEMKRGLGYDIDKQAGVPCPHLDCASFRCKIFGQRALFGFPVCDSYDCYGAGQRVSALMKARGHLWSELPALRARAYYADLNILYRLRFLITGLRLGQAQDAALLAKLEAADRTYGAPDAPALAQVCDDAVRNHRAAVEAVCRAGGTSIAGVFGA